MIKKKIKKHIKPLGGIGLFLLLVILLGLSFSNNYNYLKVFVKQNNLSQPVASSSAAVNPTPSPTPTPIPISYSPASSNGIPILTYHYIGNNPNPADKARDSLEVTPDKFEAQMQYLSTNGFTPITLDTLYSIFNGQSGRPAKAVVLTFDDGYIDFYTTAFPILRRFNFHAVSFIPTALIGGGYYMNWDQIKEIQSSGLVNFEAHTVTHVNLTSLSYAAVLKQALDSKNVLQEKTGYPVNFIAYPYGINNNVVQLAIKEAGFLGGFGTWFGKSAGMGMNMPRIKVSGFWSIEEFASRL